MRHAAEALHAEAVVLLRIEEPHVHNNRIRVLGGIHRDHVRRRARDALGTHLGVAEGIRHIELHDLATRQIGLVVVVSEGVRIGNLLLEDDLRPAVPDLLVPVRRLIPGIS